MRILSLGAGVQSSTLLVASAEGLLPRLDAAIFADTGWEPATVYEHLDRLVTEVARPAGIPVHRVSDGNLREQCTSAQNVIPTFYYSTRGKAMGMRYCTRQYKVRPILRQIRTMLGHPPPARVPRGVAAEQWIGISTDEVERAKPAPVQYVRNVFPLLDLGWSRQDCLAYLADRGFGQTPKSACIGCPYHSDASWRDMRDNHPEEWSDAVRFEEELNANPRRSKSVHQPQFLHPSRKPLPLVDLDGSNPGVERGCSPWACRGASDTDPLPFGMGEEALLTGS